MSLTITNFLGFMVLIWIDTLLQGYRQMLPPPPSLSPSNVGAVDKLAVVIACVAFFVLKFYHTSFNHRAVNDDAELHTLTITQPIPSTLKLLR
jgi:hypothetical protein